MSTEARAEHVKLGHMVFEVYNEDAGGPPLKLSGKPEEKVAKLVERLYKKLELEPQADDRLTCYASGEDVRQFGHLHLLDYVDEHCRDLVWTFVRSTGGASD